LYYILTLVYATLCDLFTAHILSFILNLFVLLPMSVVLWSMEAESALGQRVVMPYVVRHMPVRRFIQRVKLCSFILIGYVTTQCMSHIGGRMNFIIWNAILTMSLLVAGSWQQGPRYIIDRFSAFLM
jgi:hypothetical protein